MILNVQWYEDFQPEIIQQLAFTWERGNLKNLIDKFDIRILSWSLPWSVTHSLTQSVCLSTIFLPNERENILVSSVCGSVGIKYSSQILQSCSKLGRSFCHSVSFQCLFKLRNFYHNYFVSCHLFLYLNWTNISLMDTSLVILIIPSFLHIISQCLIPFPKKAPRDNRNKFFFLWVSYCFSLEFVVDTRW